MKGWSLPASLVAVLAGISLLGALAGCGTEPSQETQEGSGREPFRIVLFAIDGAEWKIINRLLYLGRLPNIQELIDHGSYGPLKTIEPTLSPAIWTTIATGKTIEEHGIFGFMGVPSVNMSALSDSRMVKVKTLWNILSERGRTVGVVGWWVTWPVEEVNGYLVSDRVTYSRMEATIDDERFTPHDTFPSELYEELLPLIEPPNDIRPAQIRHFMLLNEEDMKKYIYEPPYTMGNFFTEFKYAHQSEATVANAGMHLAKTRPTDFLAVYMTGVDTVSHLYGHFMEPETCKTPVPEEQVQRFGKVIEEYYVYTDQLIGRLRWRCERDNTIFILCSDHGFGPTGNLPWSGGHGKITPGAPIAPDGVLIISRPDVKDAHALLGATVYDIAPTVLHLMGLPVARDMPGKVLTDALVPHYAERFPVSYVETYGTKNEGEPEESVLVASPRDREIYERLRALGYVR